MKELSIEQKAQRYDEAINRMKRYVIDEYGCTRIRVTDVFPELKESKDERIRKDILGFVKDVLDNKPHLTPRTNQLESWIAWLEKQVEQKPEEVDNLHNYLYGEQKPAWSEEDEYISEAIIKRISGESDALSVNLSSAICWVENLKDRVQPQPKQEWSEEDKAILEKCIGAVKVSCYSYSFKSEAENWLKSLRPQSQWKPSEEQMDALHYVTNFDYGGHKATLVSLYEQLKKLKG